MSYFFMLVNTQYFREAAIYHQKHDKYPCGIQGSQEYIKWWLEERRRSLVGYTVGGMWITGYHYWYLNFNKIQVVKKIGEKSGKRKLDFPKFFDADYMYYMSVHIAKYGIPVKYLDSKESMNKYFDSLPVSLNITRTRENLSGGHHLIYLKPRGIGASYKNSSMASRNFHLVPESKTFLFAHDKEYLLKDGIFSKFLEYRSWINSNTEFAVTSDFKKGQTDMHFRASYDTDGQGNEAGLQSEVIGVTVGGVIDKGRGKRGILLLFEEGGRFLRMDGVWNLARESVEEGGIIYGTMIAFGTGGTEGADFLAMETMFYNPEAYNILQFDNVYDIGLGGTTCGFFTPATMNVQLTDDQGNSDHEAGDKLIDKKIKEAELSPDVALVPKRKAENPRRPLDAMLNTDTNKFATQELVDWRNKLFANKYYSKFGTPKTLSIGPDGKIKSIYQNTIPPVTKYPHSRKDDLRGCVLEYETPYYDKDTASIPDNLYFIMHDPYADDDAEDVTSLGAAYVMMNDNNIVPDDKGDKLVASYVGRPRTTDEYNRNLFMLAQRWNALIAFESDRGDVVSYAKRFNLLHWLAPEFELGFDERIKVANPSVLKYGMKMGSGKLDTKKLLANKYMEDWLIIFRGEAESGDIKFNFHYIYDVGLLDEFRLYNGKGNYDRISALRIGMFYKRELIYNDQVAVVKKKTKNVFKEWSNQDRF